MLMKRKEIHLKKETTIISWKIKPQNPKTPWWLLNLNYLFEKQFEMVKQSTNGVGVTD